MQKVERQKKPLPAAGVIKALALDLDGTTLRPDAVLSAPVAGALRACIDRGIGVIFCTGRSVGATEPYRKAIGGRGPMAYFNGAVVTDPDEGRPVNVTLLDRGIAAGCVDLARSRGVYFQVYLSGSAPDSRSRELLMAERERPETEFYRKRTGVSPVFGDIRVALASLPERAPEAPGENQAASGCIKGLFIAEPPVLEEIQRVLEESYAGSIYLARSHATFLEVMAAGVSKGRGLRLALEHRGLDPAGVIAFGDEENDLPMFSAAGYSAAPANAKERIRGAADFVIPSNAEDGVAVFLTELFVL
ncbi:MAG: Cof-type HAD-IIB family hydrolase [Spirochaetaceae bacterium]|jgi:Cof subfamily protein (haloacid dehalogenase superfamily)|nr:Cof-type HAD-IIB family hydrolase [Spirochaetaceae bacterium]